LFNLFKRFKSKLYPAGFWCGAIFVSKNNINVDSGIKTIYSCAFFDFNIELEYDIYDYTTNILGVSTISFKNTIINKENHNLKLTKLSPIEYAKKYFNNTIKYIQTLNTDSLTVSLPFFQTEALRQSKSICLNLASIYTYGSIYNVMVRQDETASYNSYLNRHKKLLLNTFQIITFNNMVFNYIYTTEYNHLSKIYKNRFEQIEKINIELTIVLKNNLFTLQEYNSKDPSVLVNHDKNAFLLYQVIKSEKYYFGSHFEHVDELFNNISIGLFWHVDFQHKQSSLHILIYDDDKFIQEYNHSMETKFNDDLLDVNYYSGYINNIVDKLIHCYYPRRKMIELMDSESLLDTFDGTLNEDEYYLFKMINI
jgi:hypothetical protein